MHTSIIGLEAQCWPDGTSAGGHGIIVASGVMVGSVSRDDRLDEALVSLLAVAQDRMLMAVNPPEATPQRPLTLALLQVYCCYNTRLSCVAAMSPLKMLVGLLLLAARGLGLLPKSIVPGHLGTACRVNVIANSPTLCMQPEVLLICQAVLVSCCSNQTCLSHVVPCQKHPCTPCTLVHAATLSQTTHPLHHTQLHHV